METLVAQPKHKSRTDTTHDVTIGSGANDEQREGSEPFDFVAALLEKPELIIADLHEEIGKLVDALIDARLRLEGDSGATRQDVALDLYDQELISKRDVMKRGGIESVDFFDLLIKRRQTRSRLKHA